MFILMQVSFLLQRHPSLQSAVFSSVSHALLTNLCGDSTDIFLVSIISAAGIPFASDCVHSFTSCMAFLISSLDNFSQLIYIISHSWYTIVLQGLDIWDIIRDRYVEKSLTLLNSVHFIWISVRTLHTLFLICPPSWSYFPAIFIKVSRLLMSVTHFICLFYFSCHQLSIHSENLQDLSVWLLLSSWHAICSSVLVDIDSVILIFCIVIWWYPRYFI